MDNKEENGLDVLKKDNECIRQWCWEQRWNCPFADYDSKRTKYIVLGAENL